MRAAIYIRWSTEDQGEGTTLDVQLDACRAYALSQGWQTGEELVFVDDGISGATMDRPALRRLREAVAGGLVDCVVVYKLDRLSRSVLDMLKLVLEEWKDRCHVKSAREPIDTMSATGRMFFYQLMSFAEWERAVIRDRMFAGKVRRAQEGKDPGITVPFGYVKEAGGTIAVDGRTAPAVQRIFRLYLSGLGCRAISRVLHQEGILSPGGGQWSQASVAQVLGNPAYTGVLWYGKKVTRGDRRVKAAEPLAVKEGFFPPLVSRAEFESVQRLRVQRPGVGKGGGRAVRSRHLLTGVLRCQCGHAMIARRFSKGARSYSYYACSAVQHAGPHRCGAGCIRQQALDGLVAGELLRRFRGARERVATVVARENRDRCLAATAACEAAAAEVRRLDEAEKRLKGMMVDGRMTMAEYRELRGTLAEKLAAARAALGRARQNQELAPLAVEADSLNTRLLAHTDEWEALGQVERKQLLGQFVSAVRVYRDKGAGELSCEICWRWGAPEAPATPRNGAEIRSSGRHRLPSSF
ncbi:MAG TPA: recombinase family protein [Symbiobacteriaceae bacterium]|nr:recombinase family protein [Symbiobacteriaceae bacterium]